MDPDQDLLDALDRQEGLAPLSKIAVGGALAALAGTVAYFTLKMQLNVSGEAAADTGILIFIASAILLAISYLRFR
jgi:hypothetical protein